MKCKYYTAHTTSPDVRPSASLLSKNATKSCLQIKISAQESLHFSSRKPERTEQESAAHLRQWDGDWHSGKCQNRLIMWTRNVTSLQTNTGNVTSEHRDQMPWTRIRRSFDVDFLAAKHRCDEDDAGVNCAWSHCLFGLNYKNNKTGAHHVFL